MKVYNKPIIEDEEIEIEDIMIVSTNEGTIDDLIGDDIGGSN